MGGAQALPPGWFQNGGGSGVSNAPAPSVHLPPSSPGHPGGGRGWNGGTHVTADNLARDAKRRAQRSPCLVENVVQSTIKWARGDRPSTTFPRSQRATPPLPPSESGDAGRAVGRGRGSGRLCRCEVQLRSPRWAQVSEGL